MFVFELRLCNRKEGLAVTINEFQLATLLRILKSRNKELYDKLNDYYRNVSDSVEYT